MQVTSFKPALSFVPFVAAIPSSFALRKEAI